MKIENNKMKIFAALGVSFLEATQSIYERIAKKLNYIIAEVRQASGGINYCDAATFFLPKS